MGYLFMAVTADKYELPIFVADSVTELSKKMKTSTSNISTCIKKKYDGRQRGYKYIKIEV